MTERKLHIYYAHHQWKYGTKIEEYELDLIKAYFPNAVIFNPSVDLYIAENTEDEIMALCLSQVSLSDIVIFSSVDGLVGVGVFEEIRHAISNTIPVFYIYKDKLRSDFKMYVNDLSDSDRTFGRVDAET